MSNYSEVTGGESKNYTIHYGENFFVSQGWQCPICHKILAPFMTYCPFHEKENDEWVLTSSTGKTSNIKIGGTDE